MRVRPALVAGTLLAVAVAPLAHAGETGGLFANTPRGPGLPARGPFVHAPHGGGASAPGLRDDVLSVDRRGVLGDDATVTLSGSYRCLDDGAGPVLLGSTLVQGGRSAAIGGTRAVCDGRPHAWVNTAVVKDPAFRPGAARVRASLARITTGPDGLPVPVIRALEEVPVTLG